MCASDKTESEGYIMTVQWYLLINIQHDRSCSFGTHFAINIYIIEKLRVLGPAQDGGYSIWKEVWGRILIFNNPEGEGGFWQIVAVCEKIRLSIVGS